MSALDAQITAACAVFAKDLGTWDAEMEITPAPGAAPMKQTAVVENRLLGGRWLIRVTYRRRA